MTVQEYIDQDLPFFHITPTRKVAHILRNGLKNLPNMLGQRLGICVVRSENQEILHIIAGEQLSGDGDREFTVFRLIPSRHGIIYEMIKPDLRDIELTWPLHNYIKTDAISVSEEDIYISSFQSQPIDSTGLGDRVLLEELTGYKEI